MKDLLAFLAITYVTVTLTAAFYVAGILQLSLASNIGVIITGAVYVTLSLNALITHTQGDSHAT